MKQGAPRHAVFRADLRGQWPNRTGAWGSTRRSTAQVGAAPSLEERLRVTRTGVPLQAVRRNDAQGRVLPTTVTTLPAARIEQQAEQNSTNQRPLLGRRTCPVFRSSLTTAPPRVGQGASMQNLDEPGRRSSLAHSEWPGVFHVKHTSAAGQFRSGSGTRCVYQRIVGEPIRRCRRIGGR